MSVIWFVHSEEYVGSILVKIIDTVPTVMNDYNVWHVSNGEIVLVNATENNTGNFTIAVTWFSFPSMAHTVPVLVFGKFLAQFRSY